MSIVWRKSILRAIDLLRLAQINASGLLSLTIGLQADSLGSNKASGVSGLEVCEGVHAGELLAVQLARLGATAEDADAALVGAKTNLTVDVVLRGEDALLDELALRGEVETVVEEFGPGERHELIPELANLTVEDEALKVKVGKAEDGHRRRITDAVSTVMSTGKSEDILLATTLKVTEVSKEISGGFRQEQNLQT